MFFGVDARMKVWVENKTIRKVRRIPHWPHRYTRWEYWGGNVAERYCKTCGRRSTRKVYFL